MQILLIDKDASLGQLYTHWLEQAGHQVTFSDDSDRGASLLTEQTDAVICHLDRFGRNTILLAHRARSRFPNLSIFFYCASIDDDVVADAQELAVVVGMEGRPTDLLAALARLQRQLRNSHSQSSLGTASDEPVSRQTRRRFARASIAIGLRFQAESTTTAVRATTVNVSAQGLLIDSSEIAEVGTMLRIHLDPDTSKLELEGSVVRVLPESQCMAVKLSAWPDKWALLCEDAQTTPKD